MVPAEPQTPRRALTGGERALIAALLDHVMDRRAYLAQLDALAVVGGCDCGCPSIDLAGPGGSRESMEGAGILVGGDAVSPEGAPVGVLLWEQDGALVSLEVHAWDSTEIFGLPDPETLTNVEPGGD